jgi:putative sigma-54 modulation protein
MRLTLRALGILLVPELRERVTRRAQLVLGRFLPRLGRVVVRLTDVNGPKGGPDKECHVQVTLPGLPEVNIYETQADVVVAVDLALGRAAERVQRALSRSPRAV